MSNLAFQVHFHSFELQTLVLPVEVRKPNLALVAQARTNETISVPSGTYFVTAKLPAGQELISRVTVAENETAIVDLEPELEDVSPHESWEVARFIQAQQPSFTQTPGAPIVTPVEEAPSIAIRLFRMEPGNEIAFTPTPASPLVKWPEWQGPEPPGVTTVSCIPGSEPLFAQILQPGSPPLNIALPRSPQRGCKLVFTRPPNGPLTVDAHPDNLTADALLQYTRQGLLGQANSLATGQAFEQDRHELQAEDLLYSKVQDPIAAAIGAYALLRMRDLDRLHNWTGNLERWFPWLADGGAIRAQHLALLGRHEQAAVSLLGLRERGLPLFSDGLSYVIDRLRLYLDATLAVFAEPAAPTGVLNRLIPFVMFADFQKPVLRFTGLNPGQPDAEPFRGDIHQFSLTDALVV